jgi:SAM-dependent methyltransferase
MDSGARELYNATRKQIGEGAGAITATPEAIRRRYRENKDWRLFPKEYVYHWLTTEGIAGRRVLDVGCGTGEISTQIALLGAHVVGIDVDAALIEISRRRAELDGLSERCDFFLGDLPALSPVLGGFDYVVCYAVLHHFDFRSQFAQLMSCLSPTGTIFIVEPVAFSPLLQRLRDSTSVPKDLDPGERQLNRDDIRFILDRVALREIRFNYLSGRLARIFPGRDRSLAILDRWILKIFPWMRRFAGQIVIRAGRRSNA